MQINLKVWRQKTRDATGGYKNYSVSEVSEHMSFFEMLDNAPHPSVFPQNNVTTNAFLHVLLDQSA